MSPFALVMKGIAICWPDHSERIQEFAASGLIPVHCRPLQATIPGSRFEDELLHQEIVSSMTEAKVLVEQYRLAYNHERPHSALGCRTPVEFAAEHACRRPGTVTSAPDGMMAFDLHQWEEELNIRLEPILSSRLVQKTGS